MEAVCLTRRKTQLRLLADACASAQPARIAIRRSNLTDRVSETRLVQLQPDGVLLHPPDDGAFPKFPPGSEVTVFFEHHGESYVFSAKACGVEAPAPGPDSAAKPLLRLSLPLRLERRRPRKEFRLALDDRRPVHARLTRIFGQRLCFDLRLTNISAGGFAGEVDGETVRQLDAGSPFWASFVLPGERVPFESVVRLAHSQPGSRDGRVVTGWTLCGGDDPALNRWNLARLQHLVGQPGKLRAGPAGARCDREGNTW